MPDTALPVRWQPDRAIPRAAWPVASLPLSLWRGARGLCPGCGETRLFPRFLRVAPVCAHCTAPLGLARADDAPPYFTILLVAHIIIPAMLFVEITYTPPIWVHTAIWVPLTLALAVGLLQPIKGATIGLMLRLGMLKEAGDA